MEARYRYASRWVWKLRRLGQPVPVPSQPEWRDGRFFYEDGRLGLWEWRYPFPPDGRPLVAIDIETTGLSPGHDGITEFALVRREGGHWVRFQSFVQPGRPIPPRIQALTGIREDDVRDAPTIEEVLEKARPLFQDATWVIQNAPFDLGFLRPHLRRVGYKIEPKVIDTLGWARKGLPGVRRYGLGSLVEVLLIPVARQHRALADAEAAMHVAHELYYLLSSGTALPLEAL